MTIPKKVKLVEVGPRDGLQNEPKTIPTEQKIEFINLLSETGLSHIEVTSFVSPKWVPQLADSTQVFENIIKHHGIHYSALVPNMQGLERAIAAGVKEIAIFTAASETFSLKNINCTIAESFERFVPVMEHAKQNNILVRGYVSCVLGCPYEGEIAPTQVLSVARDLSQLGCYEVSLGDTIGVGTPLKAQRLIDTVVQEIPLEQIAMHFHDTYGQAIANIFAVLQQGISIFDASIGGLGGCPYAKGSSGNVATEDVVYLLQQLGLAADLDLIKLAKTGIFISDILKRKTQSKVAQALAANNFNRQ